jgi:hypothetical protein
MEPMQLKAHAHALAGGLFALLDWWIDHGMAEKPEAMDALFHRMVWNGLKLKRDVDKARGVVHLRTFGSDCGQSQAMSRPNIRANCLTD